MLEREKSIATVPSPGLGPTAPSPRCQTQKWLRIWEVLHYSLGMMGISGFFSMRLEDQGLPGLRREQVDERREKSNNYPGHMVTQKS